MSMCLHVSFDWFSKVIWARLKSICGKMLSVPQWKWFACPCHRLNRAKYSSMSVIWTFYTRVFIITEAAYVQYAYACLLWNTYHESRMNGKCKRSTHKYEVSVVKLQTKKKSHRHTYHKCITRYSYAIFFGQVRSIKLPENAQKPNCYNILWRVVLM